MTPRAFGDGGGVSRRDHVIRTANEKNAEAGGLSDIDAVLRENEALKPKMGVERGVDRLFKVMDMQTDDEMQRRENMASGILDKTVSPPKVLGPIEPLTREVTKRSASDPYHPMHHTGDSFSSHEADEGLADDRYDPLTTHANSGNIMGSINNAEAAAYQTSMGIPVHVQAGWFDRPQGVSIRATGENDPVRNNPLFEVDGPGANQFYQRTFGVESRPSIRYAPRMTDPKLSDQQFPGGKVGG